jgi:hypothetical protein
LFLNIVLIWHIFNCFPRMSCIKNWNSKSHWMSESDCFCRMCKLVFNPPCGLCLKNDNHFNPFSSQRGLFDKFLWNPKHTILLQSIVEIVKVISCHDTMLKGILSRLLSKMTLSTETLFIMTFKKWHYALGHPQKWRSAQTYSALRHSASWYTALWNSALWHSTLCHSAQQYKL